MEERVFGYNVEKYNSAVKIINKANTELKNCFSITDGTLKELDALWTELGVMNPKESLLLYYLQTKSNTEQLSEKEKNKLEELSTKSKVIKEKFEETNPLVQYKKELVENGYNLKLKSSMIKDERGNFRDMKLIPPLWFFQKLEDYYPDSLGFAQWKEFKLEVTEEDAIKIGAITIVYNNIKNQYNIYNWVMVYEKYKISNDEQEEELTMF